LTAPSGGPTTWGPSAALATSLGVGPSPCAWPTSLIAYTRRPRQPATASLATPPHCPTIAVLVTPSVNPHPMVTRVKHGFWLPHDQLTLIATTSSSLPSTIPTSVHAALADPNWRAAMEDEYGALMSNGTWELVSRPRGSNVVTAKWIFTHKFLSDETFDCCKAHWVLRGFTQRPGVDYDETFSPVVKSATICMVLALITSHAWPIQQLDVKNAFLHGTLSETVFCRQPTGFDNPAKPDLVCRLNKSLYGLKQAPRAWYNQFATYLTSLGFIKAKSDTSLFILHRGPDMLYLLLYVDDIILTASSSKLLCRTIAALQWEFAMKDLVLLHHFLGITIEHRPDGCSSTNAPTRWTSSSVRPWLPISRAQLRSTSR
jgi:hypothetical protein